MTAAGHPDASIALPGDEEFEAATQVYNLAAPARPAFALTARTIGQVIDAVRFAESEGLSIRVHTTGHGAALARPMADALLIRTELDGGIDLDVAGRLARIPAGTRWGAVIDAAARHGLAVPHGSAPTVGVVGYLLRGGVSLYGRMLGLAANSVRAIELVTADGELRRVNAAADPELLWALRGGGGGFGVVTSVDVALFPVPSVVTGAAYWPARYAERLLSAWLRWTRDAPREATTSLRLMRLPQVPEVPAALSAGPVLAVDGAVLSGTGEPADARRRADDLLGPLRAVASPILDTWQLGAPPAVAHAHLDPADPVPIHGDHMLLDDIGDEGAAAFLRVAGEGSGSPLANAELRQLGGAMAVSSPAAGVLGQLDASYAYLGSGIPFGEVTPSAIIRHCAIIRAALGRWDTGRTAPTFVASLAQPQLHLSPAQVRAVDRVRARVDPSGRFRGDVAPGTSELA